MGPDLRDSKSRIDHKVTVFNLTSIHGSGDPCKDHVPSSILCSISMHSVQCCRDISRKEIYHD